MAQFTGTLQDYQNWLKQNPGVDHQIMDQNGNVQQYVNGNKGFIGNIAQGIVDPFLNTGRIVAQGLNNVTNGNEQFLSNTEQQNLPRFAVQNVAGMASNFIPGLGQGNILAKGALAGAASSFANQDITKDINPLQIAEGAVIGGGTAGLLHGLAGKGATAAENELTPALEKATQEGSNAVEGEIPQKLSLPDSQFNENTNIPSNAEDAQFRDVKDELNNGTTTNNSNMANTNDNPNALQRFRTTMNNAADVQALGGKPTPAMGGTNFLEDLRSNGISTNNLNSLQNDAQNLFDANNGKIQDITSKLSDQGATTNLDNTFKMLQDELDNAKSSTYKNTVQNVVDEIKGDVKNLADNNGNARLDDVYKLKQEYGNNGNFNDNANLKSTDEKKLWNKVYGSLNDNLDNSLKENGFNDFKDINKKVSLAGDALQYAKNLAMKNGSKVPVGLKDIMTGLGGAALSGGNPMGMFGAVAAERALTSPTAYRTIGNVVGGVGDFLANRELPNVGGTASDILQNINGKLANTPLNEIAGNQIVQTLAPGITSKILTNQNMNNNPQATNGQTSGGDVLNQLNNGQSNQVTTGQSPQNIMTSMLAKGIPLDEVMKYAQYFGPYGMMSSNPDYRNNLQASSLVNSAVQGVDQLSNRFGAGNGILSQLNASIGNDNDRVALEGQFNRLKTILPTIFGGKSTPEMMKQYEQDYIPSFNDNPNVAKQKLANLQSLIQTNQSYTPYYGTGK